MADIFLTTTCKITSYNPGAFANFDRVVKWSKLDTKKQHQVVDCPDKADIILFIGDRQIYHSGIYSSEIFKQYRHKSLVLDFYDRTIPTIPGLYATIPLKLHKYPIYEYLFYDHGGFDRDVAANLFCGYKYLFSFIGSVRSHPSLRGETMRLNNSRAYLQDTDVCDTYPTTEVYCDSIINSKFILCPRGIAAATIRVFEAMKAGRVPVIISDEWREIEINGDWQEFSVRVPERDIQSIPALLETLEDRSIEMGKKALLAWEKNFSMTSGFHWLVETCLRIQKSRTDYESIASRNIYLETFGTSHFIPYWKEFMRRRIGKI